MRERLIMRKVIVIVPIHKLYDQLTQSELRSLRQLNSVLGDRDVCIIAPTNFPVSEYERFFAPNNILVKRFKEQYFENIRSYNRLCFSKEFYERFFHYDYMLMYQTDAYVFRNELEHWTEQGYDYIGAPFYKNNSEPFDEKTWTVGNGGFSLRSVRSCYRVIERIEFYYSIVKLLNKLGGKRFVTKALIKLRLLNLAIIENIKLNRYNEDFVFGVLSKHFIRNFRVAPIEIARKFSFEAHPSVLYKLNNNQLPFGCHARDKYEPEFWKNFIDTSKNIKPELFTAKEDEACDATKEKAEAQKPTQ
jgi:hypothetical protein